jgi:Zn-dependent M28 family amino/carboxypeptidase
MAIEQGTGLSEEIQGFGIRHGLRVLFCSDGFQSEPFTTNTFKVWMGLPKLTIVMRSCCLRSFAAGVLLSLSAFGLPARQIPLRLGGSEVRTLDAGRMLEDVRVLASDAFEGRGPGSAGEDRTVEYLEEQFRKAGLKPGVPSGQWTQEVPIVGITSKIEASWFSGIDRRPLLFPQDLVAWSPRTQARVEVPACDVVFVGYGVTAPEYGWDDYKGVDVRGKTVVMLVGDPPVRDPKKPGQLDARMFGGRAMTYYGRWTYKYEEAARRGASAALLVHETQAAAYPWFVVVNSWGRERFDLADDPDAKTSIAGWLSLEVAKEWFGLNGFSYESALERAVRRDFQPVTLRQRFEATCTQALRPVRSRNVLGMLPGSDPISSEECVVYSAHWDHLGRDPKRDGDQIFNGAADNAVGVAGLLELARAFGSAPKAPRRTVLFLAPTAEEQGLLGAKYYVQHPSRPLAATVANLNMDGLNTWGRTRDIRQVGDGHSSLDQVLRDSAKKFQRKVLPDPNPERGMFYRSDHFEFMRGGVPALYLKSGSDYIDHPAGYGEKRVTEYIENDYHKVSDEVKEGWDLRGAADDLALLAEIGWRLADGRDWPQWKSSSEFRTRTRRGTSGSARR